MKAYTSCDDILTDYHNTIPDSLKMLYSGYSFEEMAYTEDCNQWGDLLINWEREWNRLESADSKGNAI